MKTAKEMLKEMQSQITMAGGLFYQYRPCRKNADIIYDIENIKRGIVFAQTPLNMNDPFDSQVGFSVKAFYEDCIDKLIQNIEADDLSKWIIKYLLLNKALGQLAKAVDYINQAKKYIIKQRLLAHKTNLPLLDFVRNNTSYLYKKCPKELRSNFDKIQFTFLCLIASGFSNVDVDENTIGQMLKMDDLLQTFSNQIADIRTTRYESFLREFISKLTVSCFSSSGWDNPLMWAHYANSYSGICVEYDFEKIQEYVGFIYPVEYSDQRPSILLKDVGIEGFDLKNKEPDKRIKKCEIDIERLLKLLLVKDSCWQYEKEWRIIDIGEANESRFINLPYIKSITLGMNIDSVCKRLILDTCKINNIPCYTIKASIEDFSLTRTEINIDLEEDSFDRIEYMEYLGNSVSKSFEKISKLGDHLQIDMKTNAVNATMLQTLLSTALEALVDIYFMKSNFNHVYNTEMNSTGEKPVIPEELMHSIKQIDECVDQISKMFNAFDLFGLLQNGVIALGNLKNLSKIKQQAKDTISSITNLSWGN